MIQSAFLGDISGQQILEEAAIQREAFYTQRAAQIRVTKYTNRYD
jgi:hypothetical protein